MNIILFAQKNKKAKQNQQSSEKISCIGLLNQYIWMLSDGLCDTEDWSDDAENSALSLKIYITFIIYWNRKLLF